MRFTEAPRPVALMALSLNFVVIRRLGLGAAPISRAPCAIGFDDVVVAGAAADVAFELVADRRLVEVVALAVDHVDGGHDHAGRAEAALQAVIVLERLLHRMQLAALREAFDGRDLRAVAGRRRASCRT